MSQSSATIATPRQVAGPSFHWWRVVIPVTIAVILALLPPPAGLAEHAWLYFAVFAGVIAALVTEPLPNPAVGVIGIALMGVLSRYTLYAPADMAKPGFNVTATRSAGC
jgi:L-tartrate/succinate antiporter